MSQATKGKARDSSAQELGYTCTSGSPENRSRTEHALRYW